jgi:hypothetical protein
MVRVADGSTYHADILVGADGAYSSIRQSLFKDLAKRNLLPKEDALPLGYDYDCIIGVTEITTEIQDQIQVQVQDQDQVQVQDQLQVQDQILGQSCSNISDISHGSNSHIFLNKDSKNKNNDDNETCCQLKVVLNDTQPSTCWYIPLKDNRIAWMFAHCVKDQGKPEDRNFKFSEWGPEATWPMVEQFSHMRTPYGGTIKDLVSNTPKEYITKIMLEDKAFKTWYSGRTVLLGDGM